ncbi:flagellar hook-length control protein FliK [Pseudogemmobacter sonorensis]|uniref:flagellar hook-length control protein FliK n=1 Tax=Pseudogemmobacter sonorensis TaxID=2989681 RepID=UPI0036CF8B1D
MPAPAPAVQIVQAALASPEGITELTLSPEELGTVRISLRAEADMVALTLLAERPETLDLMRRHAERLAEELRAAGYARVDLGFGDWGGEHPARSHEAHETHEAGPAAAPEQRPAAPSPAAPAGSPPLSTLYLRI